MTFKKRFVTIVLVCVLPLSLLAACTADKSASTGKPKSTPQAPPTPVVEISLEDAEEIFGAPLSPKYLPMGWEFKRGFVQHKDTPTRAWAILLFSDQDITAQVETWQDYPNLEYKMVLNVRQIEEMPSSDFDESLLEDWEGMVDINEVKGTLTSGIGGHGLHWRTKGLHLSLHILIAEEVFAEEIVRVAESIK